MSDVWTYKFNKHSELKNAILEDINQSEYSIIVPLNGSSDLTDVKSPNYLSTVKQDGDKINRTDYYQGIGADQIEILKSRKYFWMFYNELQEFNSIFNKKYCVAKSRLTNFWFQQYSSNNIHDWHVHGNSHLSLVYFLELPESEYSTEFFDLESRKIFQPKVSEGDIVVFPSHLPHKAPLLTSDKRKTIISWNMDINWINTNLMN